MGCSASTDTTVVKISHKSAVLKKKFGDSYYIDQANLYFDSLDTTRDTPDPKYHEMVARYEWPPWLILTGLQRDRTLFIDKAIRLSGPCVCVNRTHKVFPVNPFVRSVVTFYYGQEDIDEGTDPLRIYEEFTFNDAGEITFIEAWWGTNYKNLLPQLTPDGWPMSEVNRISTKIPGLGDPEGLRIHSKVMYLTIRLCNS